MSMLNAHTIARIHFQAIIQAEAHDYDGNEARGEKKEKKETNVKPHIPNCPTEAVDETLFVFVRSVWHSVSALLFVWLWFGHILTKRQALTIYFVRGVCLYVLTFHIQ